MYSVTRVVCLMVVLFCGLAFGALADEVGVIDAVPGLPSELAGEERVAVVIDDFEDGNVSNWLVEGTGASTASISSVAAFGTYSLRMSSGSSHFNGAYLDVTGSRPTGVAVSVATETLDTFDTYFILGDQASGDGNSGAIYFHGVNAGWSVFDGTGHTCGPRSAFTWYNIYFNVDWACKMYDVSVDGVLKQSNINFYHEATESFDRIHVYNWEAGTVARYDQIVFSTPGVSPLIFADDLERGSTCRWSSVVAKAGQVEP